MAWARRLVAAFLALLLALAAHAAEPQLPALSGRVVDAAQLLAPTTEERLAERLAEHERATGEQVVVVTVASLQGLPIEDFGVRLGRHWGIGEKGKNTGALLIVAPREREVRIEVGYGLEDRLTDALSRSIIERDIVPAFRRGEFEAGIVAGTAAMLRVLGGPPQGAAPRQRAPEEKIEDALTAFIVMLFIFFIVLRLFGRRGGMIMGPPLGGIWTMGGGRHRGGWGGGGFSGGGGSFGGGGASGRW